MGFDPRRWRPSSGSRPLTTNVEALLAENEALRREVRSLRLQLEGFLQGDAADSPSWDPPRAASEANPSSAGSRSPWGTGSGAAATGSTQQRGGPWSSAARSRASRPTWSSAEPARQRVTVGSSHGISADLVERWGLALARHPRWQELRIGPPWGLRGLEQELRRHWWNPALSLEQELDRRSPGLGGELSEALRGPHSRVRWAVRAAFALYGPRAPEWLNEEPLRVVEELLRRVQQLERPEDGSPSERRGTRTANYSGAGEDPSASDGSDSGRSAAGRSAAEGSDAGNAASARGSRHANDQCGRSAADQAGSRAQGGRSHRSAHSHSRAQSNSRARAAGRNAQEQASSGSRRTSSRQPPPRDPRSQALALLGLEPGASAASIKRAYRRLAKAHHPDLGGDVEAFRRLDAAYRSLL